MSLLSPLIQATARLNKAGAELLAQSQVSESGLGVRPLENLMQSLLSPAPPSPTEPLVLGLTGLSAAASGRVLALWLETDYFSCRGLLPARSGVCQVRFHSGPFSTGESGAERQFESLASLAETLEKLNQPAAGARPEEAAPALAITKIWLNAPPVWHSFSLMLVPSLDHLASQGQLISLISDSCSLICVAGHADASLDFPSASALAVLGAGGSALRPLVIPAEGNVVAAPAWTRSIQSRLPLMPAIVQARGDASPAGHFPLAELLAEYRRLRQIESAAQMLSDALQNELTNTTNRKRLLEPARTAAAVPSSEQPRAVAERLMKPFLDDVESIRQNREEHGLRSAGAGGSLYTAAQRIVDSTAYEELNQETLPQVFRLSLSSQTTDRLCRMVRDEMDKSLREDLGLLDEGIEAGLSGLSRSLEARTGLNFPLVPPRTDGERLSEALGAQIQLNIRYRGELPRSTWRTRFQAARNSMMAVSMFLMLASGIGIILEKSTDDSEAGKVLRQVLMVLMVFAFLGGLVTATLGYKKLHAEAVTREMEKLRDAVMNELQRLFQSLVGEKKRLLGDHLAKTSREIEQQVAAAIQSQADEQKAVQDRARQAAQERVRILDVKLRSLQQAQQAVQRQGAELVQASLQLSQAAIDLLKPTPAVPTASAHPPAQART